MLNGMHVCPLNGFRESLNFSGILRQALTGKLLKVTEISLCVKRRQQEWKFMARFAGRLHGNHGNNLKCKKVSFRAF